MTTPIGGAAVPVYIVPSAELSRNGGNIPIQGGYATLIVNPPADLLVSVDAGNALIQGADGKLYNPVGLTQIAADLRYLGIGAKAADSNLLDNVDSTAFQLASAVKSVRTGQITTAVVDGVTKSVTFGTAMPSTDYEVFMQQLGNLAVGTWVTSKSTSGFTLNVTVAVAGSFSYMAVQN